MTFRIAHLTPALSNILAIKHASLTSMMTVHCKNRGWTLAKYIGTKRNAILITAPCTGSSCAAVAAAKLADGGIAREESKEANRLCMAHILARYACCAAVTRLSVQGAWDVGTDEELYAAFRAFVSFGSGTPKSAQARACELDGKGFVKMCRDSGLMDSRLTSTGIDLIFSHVRGKVS